MEYQRIYFLGSLFTSLVFFGLATSVFSNQIFAAETIVDEVSDIVSGTESNTETIIDGVSNIVGGTESRNSDKEELRSTTKSVTKTKKTTTKPTVLPMVSISATKDTYLASRTNSATKTDTPLQDIPQAVTVISQKELKDRDVISVTEAIRYGVPGVGVSTGEGNRDAIVFRGNRTTGDFYVDGIRDDVQHFRDFYNIQRLEVLKGPNGLIFGRGGSGGIFNRVRKEANWNPVQEIRFSGGSYNHKRVTVDVGHVLHEKIAVRLNGLYQHSGSFRQGVENQRYGIAPTVTIKPTKDTRVVIQAELFKDDRIADRGIPSFAGMPFNTKRKNFFGDPNRSPTDTNKKAISMLIEHKFNNTLTVRNRTHYSIFDKFYQNVFASSAVNGAGMVTLGAYNDETDRENFFNQTDFLVSAETWGLKHKLVTGVEIGRQVTDQTRDRGHFNGVSTTEVVSALNPITSTPITFFNRGLADSNHRTTTSVAAVFIQDQIEIIPQLHAIAGIRYDRFDTDFVRKDGLAATLKARDDLISPRFGLVFKPIERVSIYGSYSLSHQPRAGDQLKSLTATNAALEPEKFINIEGGIKVKVLPDVLAGVTFFQLDRTNVILPTGVPSVTFLGRGTRVRGVETSLKGQVTDFWSVIASYAYQEGTLKTTGRSLGELPKHSYSVWNRVDFTPWLGAGFGVVGRSSVFTTTTNAVVLPAFARVDAAIYARVHENLRVQANIQNLFDVNYFAGSHNDNNIAPGSPIAARIALIGTFR